MLNAESRDDACDSSSWFNTRCTSPSLSNGDMHKAGWSGAGDTTPILVPRAGAQCRRHDHTVASGEQSEPLVRVPFGDRALKGRNNNFQLFRPFRARRELLTITRGSLRSPLA